MYIVKVGYSLGIYNLAQLDDSNNYIFWAAAAESQDDLVGKQNVQSWLDQGMLGDTPGPYLGAEDGKVVDLEEPEPGANKWIWNSDVDDEGKGEASDTDERERRRDGRTKRYGRDKGRSGVEAKAKPDGERPDVRKNERKDETERYLDEESDFWRKAESRRKGKRTLRNNGRKERTRARGNLEIEETHQERFIQMIMRGRDATDWETYRKEEISNNMNSHPWANWSSDNQKTEWESSPRTAGNVTSEREVETDEDVRRPPNNQQALPKRQKRQRSSPSSAGEELPKYKTVRRSTRDKRMSEKAKGGEWQLFRQRTTGIRQTTQKVPVSSNKSRRKVANLILVDRNWSRTTELELISSKSKGETKEISNSETHRPKGTNPIPTLREEE